ncbi:MAG: aldehyde dehydrogenase (NADP(+)) [Acidimicrobiales bacterium]
MTDNDADAPETSFLEVSDVVERAVAAAPRWRRFDPATRAEMLRAVADRLDGSDDELVALAITESHLTETRLRGELLRTTFQLRFLAGVIEEGDYLQACVDTPDEIWPPGARPDLRRFLRPLGPVAVFAASNFPFAFSVAGGDSASALAAGCPVVLKAHPGHRRLSARCGEIVRQALHDAGAPDGAFAVVEGDGAGRALITHPDISAVAFTGSAKVGRMLFDIAVGRLKPIPFYGELGSVNPVFVTMRAAAARLDEILSGYVASFTLGAGQFCTQPGILLLPAGVLDRDRVRTMVGAQPSAQLLNDRIDGAYQAALEALRHHPTVEVIAEGRKEPDGARTPTLLRTTVEGLVSDAEHLLAECFGPVSLMAEYDEETQLIEVAEILEGQLTATVHGELDDVVVPGLLDTLAEKAGRIIWNGWPTAVAVTWAMQHGGPYPATTSPLHTSVGAAAIGRFLRPVTYQGVPDRLLPAPLREGNPLGLPRRVNGRYRTGSPPL